MTTWTYDTDDEGWNDSGDMVWNGSNGSPDAGCMLKFSLTPFKTAGQTLDGTFPVTVGNLMSFRYRVKGTPGAAVGAARFSAYDNFSIIHGQVTSGVLTIPPSGDTGWVELSGTITEAGTATHLTVAVGDFDDISDSITFFAFDTVYFDEPPGGPVQLYSGTSGLSLVGDTPFTRVEPGGLAVRRDGKIAVANGLADEAERVAMWNGSSFGDVTHDYPGTAVIKRLRWVE